MVSFSSQKTAMPVSGVVVLAVLLIAAGGVYVFREEQGSRNDFASTTTGASSSATAVSTLFNSGSGTKKESGTLQGSMTIGPICPVERADHPCKPSPDMYAAHKVYLLSEHNELTTLIPDADGNFSAKLAEGTYIADIDHDGIIGSITGVPAAVVIKAGKTATLHIAIDTGIR